MIGRTKEAVAVGAAALLLFLAALGGAAWLRPQSVQVLTGADSEHSLATTGQAELDVKPDTALVTLGINIKAADAKSAQSQANQKLGQVVDAIKAQGISDDKIRTTSFNLQPEYRWDNSGQHADGYRVVSSVEVTSTNLDGVGTLIDSAVAAGANQVQGVTFTLKNRDQYKQQAIDKALADARAKADAAARRLGTEITSVRHVTINDDGSPPPVIYKTMAQDAGAPAGASGSGTPVLSGSFAFRVTVQVDFGLK